MTIRKKSYARAGLISNSSDGYFGKTISFIVGIYDGEDIIPRQHPARKNNEVQLTHAMLSMLKDQPMYGLQLSEKRYDIDNKLDFIKTNIKFALRREDIGSALSDHIKELARKL